MNFIAGFICGLMVSGFIFLVCGFCAAWYQVGKIRKEDRYETLKKENRLAEWC